MKKIYIGIAVLFLLFFHSCLNLDETVYDKYSSSEFYNSPIGPKAALANVYSRIGAWNNWYGGGWYDLNCMSTDEQVIPHRNTGDWEPDFYQIYLHEWLPSHAFLETTWNWIYESIFSANLAIDQLEKVENVDISEVSEAKVLRAYFYYLLMDDFGNVPFYTDNNITVDQIPQKNRKEIFDFVVDELEKNVENLSEIKGGSYYGRFNKWAGYALLAKVYLNAEVYTGTPRWAECLQVCEKISKGGFTLHPGGHNASSPLGYQWYELFGDACPDDETILAIYIKRNFVSNNISVVRGLIGSHCLALFGYGGWNGTVVPGGYVEKFDDNDIRKKQFLVGPQPGDVNYTLEISSLDNPGANAEDGARNMKFYPAEPSDGGGSSNDFPIYRYADILLMKAECLVRLNRANEAKEYVDQVRTRVGMNELDTNPTLDDIYNERGFELTWENHRRQDMIRFNKYLLPHDFKQASESYRYLFPIPTSALNANTLLKQNPGY